MIPRTPSSTLFPYTTLFRSESILRAVVVASLVLVGALFIWSPTANDLPRSVAVMDLLLTAALIGGVRLRSEEHTSELQSQSNLVCRLLLEKKKLQRRAAPQR